MTDQPPPRRRFQFRLRTLMIGVTAFCVAIGGFIGHERNLLKERRAYLLPLQDTHIPDDAWRLGRLFLFKEGDKSKSPGRVRLWLGDEAHESVIVDRDASEQTKQAVAALFPEADIINWP
jgi:hypothetical protein